MSTIIAHYYLQESVLSKKLLPHIELQALQATAGVSITDIAKYTNIPLAQVKSFLHGFRELSIDEIVSIRNCLTGCIKNQIIESDKIRLQQEQKK